MNSIFEQSLLVPDDAAMRALGARIAAQVSAGDLIALSGPLGAGKTTFTQGLARALGIGEAVTSPTFVLMNQYPGAPALLHLDAYRLEGLEWDELRDAGLEDFLARTDCVRVVEWPEMIAQWLLTAQWTLEIAIEAQSSEAQSRRVKVRGPQRDDRILL